MSGKKVATFKDRFSILFDESEKTAVELGKDLHVSNQTISAWKTGARSPKEPTIIAIANYFGVTVKWLMGFDVQRESERHVEPNRVADMLEAIIKDKETKAQIRERKYQEQLKLIKIFESLSDEGQEYLLQQADIAKKMFGGK